MGSLLYNKPCIIFSSYFLAVKECTACRVNYVIQRFWFHDSGPEAEWVVVRFEGANRGHVIGITSERGSVEMIVL